MPLKNEVLYCAEQIHIPQDLGSIIKIFTKDVIRANPLPKDLYKWSANYFAIKSGNKPPFRLKNHPEYNTEENLPVYEGVDVGELKNLKVPPLVIAGPSGVGKGTFITRLMKDFPDNFGFSVSHTTRGPRHGEVDGVHYHFIDRASMEQAIDRGEFIENAEVHGNLYGTSLESVQRIANQGKCCILDVDVQGVQQIRNSPLKPVAIFIAPPSIEALEQRLRDRGTETEEKIQLRLGNARGEMQFMNNKSLFDFVVINDDFEQSYLQFREMIEEHILSYLGS